MERSESIAQLAPAFARAQASIEAAHKDTVNPFFKSKYADLGEVWRVVKDALSPHGLSVIQLPETCPENGTVTLTTVLMHESGEWLAGTMPVKVGKKTLKLKDGSEVVVEADDPQGIGGAITYARRYALAGLCGVVAEADDDGNAANGRGNHEQSKPAPAPNPAAKPTPAAKPAKDPVTAGIEAVQAGILQRWAESGVTHLGIDDMKTKTATFRDEVSGGLAKKLKDLTPEEGAQVEQRLTRWEAEQAEAPATEGALPLGEDPFGDDSEYANAEGGQ